jgi:kynurenine formamidase
MRGVVFNLDYPLDSFKPPISPTRHQLSHKIFGNSPNHRDDYLDHFYLQASSHIDGLRHIRHAEMGFYNGRPDATIAVGSPTLGVNRWAEHGIVGRGVLIDVERHLARLGQKLDHRGGDSFGVGLLDDALAVQGTVVMPGDILLLHTGWARFYRDELTDEDRRAVPTRLISPGLGQAREVVDWLRNKRIAVLAADNAAVECLPPLHDSPFAQTKQLAGGPAFVASLMHESLIALLGLVVGELWNLESLAADCAADKRYEAMVISKPLNLVGGVGSPANAVAIK